MEILDIERSQSLLDDWGWPTSKQARATNHAFPSIFEEANENLLASILIYALADLRKLAREKRFEDDKLNTRMLLLPISTREIVKLVRQNQESLIQHIGVSSINLYTNALDNLDQLISRFEASESKVVSNVVVCDDGNVSELVYGIFLNSARKQITVAFRGCTTRKDWSIAANSFLTEVDNPGSGPAQIGLHSGFYNYLNNGGGQEPTKTKSILGHLRNLLSSHKNYSVSCTGHSLGGALSTLFGFQAALSWEVPNTVSIVSFASPMIGNLAFRKAFQSLEDTGDLRCLRVTNSLDLFTKLPDRSSTSLFFPLFLGPLQFLGASCLFFACCQKNIYRHVGMGLKLYRHGRYKIKLSSDPDHWALLLLKDWRKHIQKPLQVLATVPFSCCCSCLDCGCCCRIEDFGVNHQAIEHLNRLQLLAHELDDKYLNDLYEL